MDQPNPLEIENPEFACSAPREYALKAEVAISDIDSGDKADRYSTLTFGTDHTGGYPMRLAVRLEGEKNWHMVENVGAACVQFAGDYEADTLRWFFQHAGLMMVPVYGPLKLESE